MDTSQLSSLLEEELEEEHSFESKINNIEALEKHISKPTWKTDKAVDLFGRIYRSLKHHQKQQFSDLRKVLVSYHETEGEYIDQCRDEIADTVDDSVATEIDQTPAIRRGIAKKNQNTRDCIETKLRDAIKDLRDDIEAPACDFQRLEEGMGRDDKQTVRSELGNLTVNLRMKGWYSEDLDNLPRKIRRANDPQEQLRNIYRRDELEFRFLIFLPMVEVTNERQLNKFTVYPPGTLDFDDLENSEIVRENHPDMGDIERITDLLSNVTPIKFAVTAFEQKGATEKAKMAVSRFLDASSAVHQIAYLNDPQFDGKFQYIIWRSDEQTLPVLSWSRETRRPASLADDQLDVIEESLDASDKESLLGTRYDRAQHFLRRGNISDRDLDTVIYYIACLETTASQEYSNTTNIIKNALLLGRVPASSHQHTRDLLSTLYDVRNAALHSGRISEIENSKLNGVRGLLFSIIYEMKDAIEDGKTDFSGFYDYVDSEINSTFDELRDAVESNGLTFEQEYSFSGEVFQQDGTRIANVAGDLRFVQDGRYVIAVCNFDDIEFADVSRSPDDVLQLVAETQGLEIKFGKMPGHRLLMDDIDKLEFGVFEIQ
jgi:hypothetical protein